LARKRDLSTAIQTARGKFTTATHPLWGILREYPRDPLELRDFPVFQVAFPSGVVPSRVPFNQLETIRVRIPCRSSNSLVLARPLRARRNSRLAAAAKPMASYSAFDGASLLSVGGAAVSASYDFKSGSESPARRVMVSNLALGPLLCELWFQI
jgi:hypothetical protein